MSRKIFLDAFFSQFNAFLEELIVVFPDDPDYVLYKIGLNTMRKVNPTLVVTEVHKHILPYESQLRKQEDAFFLAHDFSDYVGGDSSMEQVVHKIKHSWTTLSESNKQCIWKYITLLLDLSIRLNQSP